MSLVSKASELEHQEIENLKAFQARRRDHEAAKTRVTAAAEALSTAEADHQSAATERVAAKNALDATLKAA